MTQRSSWEQEQRTAPQDEREPSQKELRGGKTPSAREGTKGLLTVPYPQPVFKAPNPGYAAALQNAYAGETGEFSSVARYFFQGVMLEATQPRAAAVLRAVAKAEMKHLALLAQSIAALGGVPVFAGSRRGSRIWWNGAHIPYRTELRMMLLKNIEAEQASIREYRRLSASLPSEQLQALFLRVIMDEEHHIELFGGLLKDCCGYE